MIQLQTLNYILSTKDNSLITQNNLDNRFFSNYESEFNFLSENLSRYGKVPDVETFLHRFPDFRLIKVTESKDFLLKSLYEDYSKRYLAEVFNKMRGHLMQDHVEEALQLLSTASQSISQHRALNTISILQDTSRYDKYLEKCKDYSRFYVKTGFPELDKIIGGWDREEELATIAARPNVGKSYITLACALAAARQGLIVGIYSGEMSEYKVGYRLDTLITHLSNSSIIKGNDSIQNEYKAHIDSLKDQIKGDIKVLTPAGCGGPAGVNALRAFIERDSLDILFVDQHSLLEDDRKAKNPIERAANISRDLKNLQVMKRIPIIAVSQQNRTSTESGVGTEHIAQSDRIGQDSTIVLFLEKEDDVLTIDLVKSRDSSNGKKLNYLVNFDKGIFKYLPTEDLEQDAQACEDLRKEFEEPDEGETIF